MLLEKVIICAPRMANVNISTRGIFKFSRTPLDRAWRTSKRLTNNPNTFGPLTNLPDYSFKDGRPAPFGVRQMIRINKQREYFLKIKELTGEIDQAVEKHQKLEEKAAIEKQKIIDSKLKPKGLLF